MSSVEEDITKQRVKELIRTISSEEVSQCILFNIKMLNKFTLRIMRDETASEAIKHLISNLNI